MSITNKKQIIAIDITTLPMLEEYIQVDREIKRLEAEKESLREKMDPIILQFFDPTKTFDLGGLATVTGRQMLELDQDKIFREFQNKVRREQLFPSVIKFAAGEAKETIVNDGLGVYKYGNPVLTVKKAK